MFLFGCIALLLVSVLILALPWWRAASSREVAAQDLNANLRAEQWRELDERLAQGLINAADHEQMGLEIDKRLLAEAAGDAPQLRAKDSPKWLLLVLLALVAVGANALYQQLGQQTEQQLSERFKAVFNGATEDTAKALAVYEDITAYAQPANADNIEWLYMAAQGYMQLGHYRKASQLYDRMVEVAPMESQLLANAAQAHYLANQRTMTELSQRYLDRAFAINPHQQNALGFAGMAAFENEDFAAAVRYWQRAVDGLGPMQRQDSVLVGALEEAKRRANLAGIAVDQPEADTAAEGRTINVSLVLGDNIDVAANKTVFILARAKAGPPMPLAAKRMRVADLPLQIQLSEADAMTPAFSLASFDEVVVTARISQTGNALTQSGDIGANEVPVLLDGKVANVALVLDRVIP